VSSGVGVAVGAAACPELDTVQNSFAGAVPLAPSVLYPTLATVTPGGKPTALQNVSVCPDLIVPVEAVHPSKWESAYAVFAPYV
jgi:hypothetical protein